MIKTRVRHEPENKEKTHADVILTMVSFQEKVMYFTHHEHFVSLKTCFQSLESLFGSLLFFFCRAFTSFSHASEIFRIGQACCFSCEVDGYLFRSSTNAPCYGAKQESKDERIDGPKDARIKGSVLLLQKTPRNSCLL